MIVFLLCYICWLRRSFDSDLPPDPAQQPLRYYRNTQPHYQFNMDVSVDKFSTRYITQYEIMELVNSGFELLKN